MKNLLLIPIFLLGSWIGLHAQVLLSTSTSVVLQTQVAQSNNSIAPDKADTDPNFTVIGKKLHVNNLTIGTTVNIYSVLGAKVYSFVYKGNPETLSLSKGIYIVRSGNYTQKVML